MTQQEKKNYCKAIVEILQQGGYIKGYGDKKRVMTYNHNPHANITAQIYNLLKLNKLIVRDNLVDKWSRTPFPNDKFMFDVTR